MYIALASITAFVLIGAGLAADDVYRRVAKFEANITEFLLAIDKLETSYRAFKKELDELKHDL